MRTGKLGFETLAHKAVLDLIEGFEDVGGVDCFLVGADCEIVGAGRGSR